MRCAGAGRHAEALITYHDADRLLGEELGTEPGHELRQLHAEALAGTAPAQQPTSSAGLERLRRLLAEALSIVTTHT